MSDRSREVLVNILCGAMTDMRAATQAEQNQYRQNTGTNFDLLVVGKNQGVAEAHVARPGLAGAFDFDRIKRYEKPWFEMNGQALLEGAALSEVYPGRRMDDPFLAKAVAVMREHIPEYAGKLLMHGSAFPAMVLDMAADYVDRATFDDKKLSLESSRDLHSFLQAMAVSSANNELSNTVLTPTAFREMRSRFDNELAAFEANSINQLVEEIDLSATPLPS